VSRVTPAVRGARLAVSMFTAWRVDVEPPDRAEARWAMTFLPVVGLGLGILAAGAGWAVRETTINDATPVFASVVAILVLTLATRAMHLDGLADTVDGLGSLRPPDEALDIMRRGDTGPMGVVALVLVLILQIGALATCLTAGHMTLAVVVAVVTGRVAAVLSLTPRTPGVGDGLGALFAGTVPRLVAFGWAAVVTAGAFTYGNYDDRGGGPGGLHAAIAVVLGLAVAHVLRAKAVRRLGGVNGDVLGAQVEVATMVVLFVLALS
jgi:adenosylcobinamide-GDP ribazoletransferase